MNARMEQIRYESGEREREEVKDCEYIIYLLFACEINHSRISHIRSTNGTFYALFWNILYKKCILFDYISFVSSSDGHVIHYLALSHLGKINNTSHAHRA